MWTKGKIELQHRLSQTISDRMVVPDPAKPCPYQSQRDFTVEVFLEFLESLPDIELDSLDDPGLHGFVFRGKSISDGQPTAMKLVLETQGTESDPFWECPSQWSLYQDLKKEKVPYLVDMKEPIYKVFPSPHSALKPVALCGFQTELAKTADDEIFRNSATSQTAQNDLLFLDFVQKVFEAIAALNKAGFYHANLKPVSILVAKTASGFEPRLTNLQLAFKKVSGEPNPPYPLYPVPYRPPELLERVPNLNARTYEEKKALREYKFNDGFREETWAAGRTIWVIYETNHRYLDRRSDTMLGLVELLKRMMDQNIDTRLTMAEAWSDSLKIPGVKAVQSLI